MHCHSVSALSDLHVSGTPKVFLHRKVTLICSSALFQLIVILYSKAVYATLAGWCRMSKDVSLTLFILSLLSLAIAERHSVTSLHQGTVDALWQSGRKSYFNESNNGQLLGNSGDVLMINYQTSSISHTSNSRVWFPMNLPWRSWTFLNGMDGLLL